MAGDRVAGRDVTQGGDFLFAPGTAPEATRVEGTARRYPQRARHIPFHHDPLLLRAHRGGRDGGKQRPAVGVVLAAVKSVPGCQLHDTPEVHHRDAVAHMADHAEVMGDENVGQAVLLLEPDEKVDDLGLDGYVQRGNGFIGHDELRMDGQGAGDADAADGLPAAEFVGKTVV